MMADQRKPEQRGRTITIWVMKDATSAPAQFMLEVRSLKIAASILLLIPLVLLGTGIRCALLSSRNHDLARLSSQRRASQQKLDAIRARVDSLENNFTTSCRRTGNIIAGMEKDLKHWLPGGAIGGGENEGDAPAPAKAAKPLEMDQSQIEQVNNIQLRLARLDRQIQSYELTLQDLEDVWDDRKTVFAVFPSIWPLNGGRITSGFGVRVHPITRKLQRHEGIDIAADPGTPIYAVAPGVVVSAGRTSGYGNAVEIDHGYGISTYYAHARALFVRPGQSVKKGQKIAEVGSTGFSTGPHLHFEVRIRGMQVDPMQYLSVFAPGPDTGDPAAP
ncbi:MAG TPA: M23 family metallopeptidase [bacterium]|nr:M23 family metallopeptidase [bacterium]